MPIVAKRIQGRPNRSAVSAFPFGVPSSRRSGVSGLFGPSFGRPLYRNGLGTIVLANNPLAIATGQTDPDSGNTVVQPAEVVYLNSLAPTPAAPAAPAATALPVGYIPPAPAPVPAPFGTAVLQEIDVTQAADADGNEIVAMGDGTFSTFDASGEFVANYSGSGYINLSPSPWDMVLPSASASLPIASPSQGATAAAGTILTIDPTQNYDAAGNQIIANTDGTFSTFNSANQFVATYNVDGDWMSVPQSAADTVYPGSAAPAAAPASPPIDLVVLGFTPAPPVSTSTAATTAPAPVNSPGAASPPISPAPTPAPAPYSPPAGVLGSINVTQAYDADGNEIVPNSDGTFSTWLSAAPGSFVANYSSLGILIPNPAAVDMQPPPGYIFSPELGILESDQAFSGPILAPTQPAQTGAGAGTGPASSAAPASSSTTLYLLAGAAALIWFASRQK